MGFRFEPKSVTLNALKGVLAINMRYFAEFGRFRDKLRKSG